MRNPSAASFERSLSPPDPATTGSVDDAATLTAARWNPPWGRSAIAFDAVADAVGADAAAAGFVDASTRCAPLLTIASNDSSVSASVTGALLVETSVSCR